VGITIARVQLILLYARQFQFAAVQEALIALLKLANVTHVLPMTQDFSDMLYFVVRVISDAAGNAAVIRRFFLERSPFIQV
jgi:hypothetical protein